MKARHLFQFVAVTLLATGCASSSKSKISSNRNDIWYAVAANQTPFYRYGPQQGNGPDMQLPRDSIMKVIRPSFGYVKVKLQDGQSGYVASEDIQPAAANLVAEKLAPLPEPPPPTVASQNGSSEQGEQFGINSDDPRLIAPPEPLPESSPTPSFHY